MNRILKSGGFILVLIIALSFPVRAQVQQDPRLITVSGDAEVRVIPDEVILTFGVETWDKTITIAKKQNDDRVQRILAVARKYRVEPEHVQTDHISIEPRYKKVYDKSEFIGYLVRKTIVITLRDISKFEDILSNAIEVGANYVHGIQFRTTELRKYRDQARALAINAAKEKAVSLASELGQEVGLPHTIREERSDWWCWYNSWWGSGRGGMSSQNVIQNVGEGQLEGESSIALGQINVNARVTVSFELK